eukprot:3255251-Rhodomonas_salina.3
MHVVGSGSSFAVKALTVQPAGALAAAIANKTKLSNFLDDSQVPDVTSRGYWCGEMMEARFMAAWRQKASFRAWTPRSLKPMRRRAKRNTLSEVAQSFRNCCYGI